ncbi:MAG: N-acetyl-gamma-glutamyl-phosphate reductase [Actinomycetota bacterium]|nr:N-acetyl-gamma-glutamyl-phosphate reductase [Actinomycetota bacterium]
MALVVGVVGASGYGGAELLRLIAGHPALEVGVVAAQRHAGQKVAEVFPNLAATTVFVEAEVDALDACDLVFLATPHAAAMQLTGALHQAGIPVVDLSAAFRLQSNDFAAWYGESHLHPDLAPRTGTSGAQDGRAAYGLSEWNRPAIRDAPIVANPGCYPAAALLALLPLAHLVLPGSIVVDAKSGTSGAGRRLQETLHHPHVHDDVAAYGAPTHRHTIEIERWLSELGGSDLGPVSFTPHLVPMARGLLATCYADLREDVTPDDVTAALVDRYAEEPFVRVLPSGRFPHTKAVSGSNGCQLAAVVDERTRRVVVTSAIDNLGKGAADQALQNANLVLGLDEGLGLTAVGVYP